MKCNFSSFLTIFAISYSVSIFIHFVAYFIFKTSLETLAINLSITFLVALIFSAFVYLYENLKHVYDILEEDKKRSKIVKTKAQYRQVPFKKRW